MPTAVAVACAGDMAAPELRVLVKNTFLDLDDAPRLPELARARSEPNQHTTAEESEEDEEEDEEGRDTVGEPATLEAPAFEQDDLDAPPVPGPEDLYRTRTCDGYEPTDMWTWVNKGGDPNTIGNMAQLPQGPLPTYAPQEMAAPMPQPQPATPVGGGMGIVMVPVQVMMPMPDPGMPAQEMQAVPVGPFTRWPEPQPAPSGPSAAAPSTPAPELSRVETPGEPPAGLPSVPPGEARLAPEDIAIRSVPDVPRAPVLERHFSVTSQVYRVRWTVDARKLKTSDREAVSPLFELSFSQPVQFKMVIRPKCVHELRGGASFKKAKGKGTVEMRCLEKVGASANPVVTFRIAVGSGSSSDEPPRGPVRHDFSERAICGLPEAMKEWDFAKHVDPDDNTFVVCLEILSGAAAAATTAVPSG